MILGWLLLDEMRHLVRSKAVLLVVVLLPMVLGVGALQPGDRLANLLLFMVAMGSNLAGLVCGATVTASCVADLQQGTPVLFAVRPLPRFYLLLARFLSVVLLLAGTMSISLGLAVGLIKVMNPSFPVLALVGAKGFVLICSNALLQGALGILLGVSMSSVLPAVILYIFLGVNLGNGLSFMLLEGPSALSRLTWVRDGLALGGAILLTSLLLWAATLVISRRPL